MCNSLHVLYNSKIHCAISLLINLHICVIERHNVRRKMVKMLEPWLVQAHVLRFWLLFLSLPMVWWAHYQIFNSVWRLNLRYNWGIEISLVTTDQHTVNWYMINIWIVVSGTMCTSNFHANSKLQFEVWPLFTISVLLYCYSFRSGHCLLVLW